MTDDEKCDGFIFLSLSMMMQLIVLIEMERAAIRIDPSLFSGRNTQPPPTHPQKISASLFIIERIVSRHAMAR